MTGSPIDPPLLDELARRRIVRLCAAITRDPAAAEDLAQETLLEAWRNLHKLRDRAGADRWLAAIARNVCSRWARKRGRELPLVALDAEPAAEDELGRAELVELVECALGLLPPRTREILVQRYVHESPHAEIAERLGLSEDAVSMRLTRGKVVLRRLLAAELDHGDGWQETRVWCRNCGQAKLQLRLGGAVSFRCPACTRSGAAAEFRLENPVFRRLLTGLVRPTAMLRRTADWAHRYFDTGAGGKVACTRCGHSARLRRYAHDRGGRENEGLYAECARCGEQVCSSVGGLVVSLPAVQRFRRDHPRSRNLPSQAIAFAGRPAILVRHEDLLGSAGVEVVLAHDTLRVLRIA